MPHTDLDTLVVGQGLAGSALAWQLAAAGDRVCVIDDGDRSASSRVAAGLINPLAGLRFNRRPETLDCLQAAEAWYGELHALFGRRFLHPLPMLRPFRSPEQRRFYQRRAADPASRGLLGDAFDADACPEPVEAPHGGFVQRRTGYVDLPLLLATLRDWLRAREGLVEARFQPAQLRIGRDRVEYGGLSARRLVFCEGAGLAANPWFGELPLSPEKGEILDLAIDDWQPRHIVNAAYWLLPTASGCVRLGATHEHGARDAQATAAGRAELLAGLRTLRPRGAAPRVLQHRAGVRPGTCDRYPLLGRHRELAALWVFNGLGARGTLLAPWYAARMAAHLCAGEPLPVEVDIRRFACADRG